MKTIRTTVLLIIATIKIVGAQVDTTDWFPMQTGNYWEYMAWTGEGPKYFSHKIVGDTIILGTQYRIIREEYFDPHYIDEQYFREDSNFVYKYIGDEINCIEIKYLDFNTEDSTIWATCSPIFENARGIASTIWDYTYYTFLQKPNEAKQFEDVHIDSVDTIWTPTEASFPIVLNKGLGIVWHFRFNDGSYYLQGAIINGVEMGTLVDVEKVVNTIPNNLSLKSYPNPFNSSTTLQINLPETDQTELSVYNILGQKIATLINEQKTSGNYNIQFNANHLSSGVYFVLLKQNNLITKQKIILLK